MGNGYGVCSNQLPPPPVDASSVSFYAQLGLHQVKGKKVKEADFYIAPLLKYLTLKALRYGSHSVTCKLHRTCLVLVSIHQMAHPRLRLRTSNCSLLVIYLPRKDERLSWPGWLVT